MISGEIRARWTFFCAAMAAVVALSGCGDQSRPVVTPSNPSGPASEVTSYAVAITAQTSNSAGLATVIDYSGDSIMASAQIGPSATVSPNGFTIDYTGSTGYSLNSDGSLSNFAISTTLKNTSVSYSTLPTSSHPVGMFSPASALWLADVESTSTSDDAVDILSSSPATYQTSALVAPTPITLTGLRTSGAYYYSISRNNSSTASPVAYDDMSCNTNPSGVAISGEADAIDVSSRTLEARIALGACPVYAVTSSDGLRVFVLNRGSDTISVINTQRNALDNLCMSGCQNTAGQTYYGHPTITLPSGSGPVFAEYNAATSILVVANYDGGTVSLIDVSMDEYGNDSSTFGSLLATISLPSGSKPASVAVLSDGSKAYTANQVGTLDTTGANGDVTVVNLKSYIVEKTLAVTGHPRTVVSTNNSTNGKVYVASPDSKVLTVINTYTDTVTTSLELDGDIIDVRTTTKDGTSGSNTNVTSWIPGSGRPCNTPASGAVDSLEACMAPLSLPSSWLTF